MIQRCRQSFYVVKEEIGVSETPKIHVVLTHIVQFIYKTGCGLGKFSEQELENSHSAFQDIWKIYLIKDTSSELYLDHYYRAHLNFNSNNI